MLERIKNFPIEHELIQWFISRTILALMCLITLYALACCFIMAVCWITGLPPAHLLPGMGSYEQWRVK